jgi:hypothetical protein
MTACVGFLLFNLVLSKVCSIISRLIFTKDLLSISSHCFSSFTLRSCMTRYSTRSCVSGTAIDSQRLCGRDFGASVHWFYRLRGRPGNKIRHKRAEGTQYLEIPRGWTVEERLEGIHRLTCCMLEQWEPHCGLNSTIYSMNSTRPRVI